VTIVLSEIVRGTPPSSPDQIFSISILCFILEESGSYLHRRRYFSPLMIVSIRSLHRLRRRGSVLRWLFCFSFPRRLLSCRTGRERSRAVPFSSLGKVPPLLYAFAALPFILPGRNSDPPFPPRFSPFPPFVFKVDSPSGVSKSICLLLRAGRNGLRSFLFPFHFLFYVHPDVENSEKRFFFFFFAVSETLSAQTVFLTASEG